MDDPLAAYLLPIDRELVRYLDEQHELTLPCVEHLYRYAVALLQGLVSVRDVREDWEDFFSLAGGFVFAYGSERLSAAARSSSLLWVGRADGAALCGSDRTFLLELVRELGAAVCARRAGAGG